MDESRSRLTQIFKFLKELNELRNPVPRGLSAYSEVLRLDSWPVHPLVEVRRGDRAEDDDDLANGAELEPLIRIGRANLTQCPRPPYLLDGWLKPGWHSADAEVTVLSSRNVPGEGPAKTVAFEDDAERVKALTEWTESRGRWIAAEQPAMAARELFEQVHALWTTLQREGDRVELMLGDGMLGLPNQLIRHPVLLQRIDLGFDPSVPEFRFHTGTEKVELYRSLLRLVPGIEGRIVAVFDRELDVEPVEPLGGETTGAFLRRLAQGLFTDGEFLNTPSQVTASNRPRIWREPVIFLRPRSAGLNTTLDLILNDLQGAAQPPEGLSRIAGVESDQADQTLDFGDDDAQSLTPQGPEPDILFSKPSNCEQHEIAARLAKSKAVLVQGPPGTGKTHTIANLLGHLLAQGKTVLVTAHTTKALRVLRGQVDEALQPLCLSVLEGDAGSQAGLSSAAQEIARRLSHSDAPTLRRDAALLREKRRKLLEASDRLRRELRDARFGEIEEVVLGGEAVSPIEAAKRVKANAARDGWIPGPLSTGTLNPLTDREVNQLYGTNGALTQYDEAQLAVPQPARSELVSPADFRLLAGEQEGASVRAQAHRAELWSGVDGQSLTASHLRELHKRIQAATLVLEEDTYWLREILFAGWSGGDLRGSWDDLRASIEALSAEAGNAHRLMMAHGPKVPENRPAGEVSATLCEIVAHLEDGGSLGFKTRLRHRDWHKLIDECQVEGQPPRTLDEFRALRASARLEESRKQLAARWRRAVESLGGPAFDSFGRTPERGAFGYVTEIRTRLEWRAAVWEPLISELRATGFNWDAWFSEHPPVPGDHGELARVRRAGSGELAALIEAQASRMRQAELSAALGHQRVYLAGFAQSEVAAVLIQAQDAWDADNYDEASRELARLEGLRELFNARRALLARLERSAPVWARMITERTSPHQKKKPPGNSDDAWRWRQWHQELERRASVSITDLQERLDRTEDELRRLAAQIIERETWAAQRERTGLESQQALMGFVQTMRKIGKGTGRRVPGLLREARNLLAAARSAVPVWIMPLGRVYESFDPRTTRFDVVIIDEASQSDVTALAALYLGREHIVVGDNEQVTPDAVGQRVEDVERLIAADLQDIPNSHLYDGQTSIYDLAEAAFGGAVALREHFRCVPEIIQFSNHLSYNDTIRPLREPSSAPVRPALVAHWVHGFRDGEGKRNLVEAEEVASLVISCIHDPQYAVNHFGRPMTFGVISLLGEEQALLIELILRRNLSPELFAKHRLLCGNAAQFQGDERDIIFLSMVDGPPADGQLPIRDAGPKDLYKKRYNVAVSRARNQLWVVHSLDPSSHLKPRDLRQRLIEHARDPYGMLRLTREEGNQTESPFEKLVLQRLVAAGYRVRTRWPVGAYRIDLVVEGRDRRLAVECDGEKWHTAEELQRDLQRQAILERLGWVFIRIRGSVFFRDPDRAMAPVFSRLDQLSIEPLGVQRSPEEPANESHVERVKRSAEELRRQWQRDSQESSSVDVEALG